MQKTIKSNTNDFTGTTEIEEYGTIMILDDANKIFTSDDLGDGIGSPIALTAETYGKVLEAKTISDTDRSMLLAKAIFTVDKNAQVKIYGEDITASDKVSASYTEMISRLEKYNDFNDHIVGITSITEADIKSMSSLIDSKRKIFIGMTTSSTASEVSTLRTGMNSKIF